MKEILFILAAGYLLIMNLAGLVTMGIDKKRAVDRGWRIPERTLILIAFAGGAFGTFFGMHIFRHKTKHMKFIVLIPLALMVNVLLCIKISTFLLKY